MSARRRTSFALFNTKTEPPKIEEAPTDPLPLDGSKPSDILINRLHEIKRISKSLSGYFEGLSAAHVQQASTILKLSATSILQTPFPESSLFLPSPIPKGSINVSSGWAELILNLRDETRDGAERHAEIGRILSKQVVVPLKKMRVDIKAHISMMEKEITKLSDSVLKERDMTNNALNFLTKSVSISTPTIPLSSADDPFLLKSAAEVQMKVLIAKENELLKLVLLWQERSFALEKETWQRITACWKIYEAANSNLLLSSQQHSVLLSANVDSIPPEAEWNFFLKLNHIIPLNTPLKLESGIDYPHRNDPATVSSREGILERQKRFTKSWKSAFFILTPSGHLHEYSTSASILSKPYLSLALASCTLGPMPTPESNVKGRALEPCFTIEAPDGRSIFRARSWEELSSWWAEIEKFTISTIPPEPPTSPLSPRGGNDGQFETNHYPAALDLDEHHLRSSPSSPTALHPMSNRRSSDNSIQSFQSADSASSSSGDIGSSTGLHSLPIPVPTSNSKRRVPVPSPLAPNRPASPIRIVLRPVPTPSINGLDGDVGEKNGGSGGGGGGGGGHGGGSGSANFGSIDLMDESKWPISPERNLNSSSNGGMGRRVNSSGSVEGNLGFGGAERIPLPNSPTTN